jgi:Spy/CpxP family protein refolding chaperone
MCSTVILAVVGGALAAKMIHRFKHGGGHCGGGRGFRGRRFGWRGRGMSFGGPGRLFWLFRELDLDRQQKKAVWEVLQDVRHTVGEARFGAFQGLDAAADALGGETFDRAKVDAEAEKQGNAFKQVRESFVIALERIHGILTPDQRERLRDILGGEREVDAGGPDGGPYRT